VHKYTGRTSGTGRLAIIFSTFYFPARRPPVNIGINEHMAATFLGQLSQPFTRQRALGAATGT
jgi:hypothetical protein